MPLTSSVVLGLAPAVRADFANIVISSGDANDATRLLAKHRITDITVLDTIAASYVELGRLDDAYDINELAIATDDRKNHANRCRRLTRRYALRPPPKRLKAIDLPNAGLFEVPEGADATCTRLEHELECWLDSLAGCGPYHADQKLDVARAGAMLDAYFTWPSTASGNWWGTANMAILAMPHPGADRLAVAALANNLRSTRCDSTHVNKIILLANDLRMTAHDPAINDDLTQLLTAPLELCLDPDTRSKDRLY